MKKFVVLILICMICYMPNVKANIICNDGSVSPSCGTCGRGCCSHHGGCSSRTTSNTSSSGKSSTASSNYSNSSSSNSSRSSTQNESSSTKNTSSIKVNDGEPTNHDDNSSDDGSWFGTVAIVGGILYLASKSTKKKKR